MKAQKDTKAPARERLQVFLSRFTLEPGDFPAIWKELHDLGLDGCENAEDFDLMCSSAKNLLFFLKRDRERQRQRESGVSMSEEIEEPTKSGSKEYVPSSPAPSTLTPSERARNTALANYRVRQASFDSSVQWFRKEVLGGSILEWNDALTFAASPVLAILSREDLADFTLSPIDLSVKDVAENREYNSDDGKVYWHLTGTIMQSGTKLDIHRQGASRPPILWCMAMQGDGEYWKTGRAVRQSSVLHDLLGVTESLVRRYGWSEVEATLFILMDGMPHTHPIEIKTDYPSRERPVTTITVEPWMSWKTVEKVYKAEQREVYEVVPVELRRFGGHSMICTDANRWRCPDAERSCSLSPRLQG